MQGLPALALGQAPSSTLDCLVLLWCFYIWKCFMGFVAALNTATRMFNCMFSQYMSLHRSLDPRSTFTPCCLGFSRPTFGRRRRSFVRSWAMWLRPETSRQTEPFALRQASIHLRPGLRPAQTENFRAEMFLSFSLLVGTGSRSLKEDTVLLLIIVYTQKGH